MTAYARPLARTSMPATYLTDTTDPTVFFTALLEDSTILVDRTSNGITLTETGLYEYIVPVDATTDTFVARWDEGDPGTYSEELVVVPRGDRGPSGTGGGAVSSVAGKTGVVSLVEADIAGLVADLAALAAGGGDIDGGTASAVGAGSVDGGSA